MNPRGQSITSTEVPKQLCGFLAVLCLSIVDNGTCVTHTMYMSKVSTRTKGSFVDLSMHLWVEQ